MAPPREVLIVIPPFESEVSPGNRRRMLRTQKDVIAVETLSGTLAHIPFERKEAPLTFGKREIPLIVEHVENNRQILPADVAAELEAFITKNEIGNFTVLEPQILPHLGVTRALELTHPSLPGTIIHASGIGKVKKIDGGVELSDPDESSTIHAVAVSHNQPRTMATEIIGSDGNIIVRENNAPVGAYILGTQADLKLKANGAETLIRKMHETAQIAKGMRGELEVPKIVMHGHYKDKPWGWMIYLSPDIVSGDEVYEISKKVDAETKENQYLFEMYGYDLAQTIGMRHRKLKKYMGQPHLRNWGVTLNEGRGTGIYMSDWGTTVDFSEYSALRSGFGLSPYEKIMYKDVLKTIIPLISRPLVDLDASVVSRVDAICMITAYTLTGYFGQENINARHSSIATIFNEVKGYVRSQEHNLMAGDGGVVIGILEQILLRMFIDDRYSKGSLYEQDLKGQRKK